MITVKNTGCGLGDMLGRIDLVYKISLKYHLKFVMPDISSGLHSKNYGDELGFNNYKPNRVDWAGPVKSFPMSDIFVPEKLADLQTNSEVLHEVIYDHSIVQKVIDYLGLKEFKGFDYSNILTLINRSESIDYLVHLRLGDNYLYKINEDMYLDAGRRRLVWSFDEGVRDLLKDQWTIPQVLQMVDFFESAGLKYRFISDGVQSAIRHVNWTKTDEYLQNKECLLQAIDNFESQLYENFRSNNNFYIGSEDVMFAIESLISTKYLVCTVGGFMRHLNKYLNSSRAEVLRFEDFYKNVS